MFLHGAVKGEPLPTVDGNKISERMMSYRQIRQVNTTVNDSIPSMREIVKWFIDNWYRHDCHTRNASRKRFLRSTEVDSQLNYVKLWETFYFLYSLNRSQLDVAHAWSRLLSTGVCIYCNGVSDNTRSPIVFNRWNTKNKKASTLPIMMMMVISTEMDASSEFWFW